MSDTSYSPEAEAVLQINQSFYDAFESMDFEAMSAVWSQQRTDTCVHPGWPFLRGWRDIRESWRAIFANTGFMRISLTEVSLEIRGDTARIHCVENLYSVFEDQTLASQVAATNLFARVGGQWRMTVHHGSPIANSALQSDPAPDIN